MTDWCSWLDVQNGASFGGSDQYEEQHRFITTPRDLATYVHFDQLYQAYLNACLIMLSRGDAVSAGFPEPNENGTRTPFATYGGPHILSLVCEVATRCLKAVRREKFNYHRRARPEALAGRLTLQNMQTALPSTHPLGDAQHAIQSMLTDLPADLKQALVAHNLDQNKPEQWEKRRLVPCTEECFPEGIKEDFFNERNLLLPMAFPEGSPMHPAYGAGHATVAGGCVTMLKAFFEMFDLEGEKRYRDYLTEGVRPPEKLLFDDKPAAFVPDPTGQTLSMTDFKGSPLTIQGELDKLAANVAIGRNMAGVHYYTDYYDSIRMGERIALGILQEQMATYPEYVSISFTSFDGDFVLLSGRPNGADHPSTVSLEIYDETNALITNLRDWWLRHVPHAPVTPPPGPQASSPQQPAGPQP